MIERKASYLSIRSTSSFLTPKSDKTDPFLPTWTATSVPEKPARLRVRSILGHCLYRRVVLWVMAGLFILVVMILKARERGGTAGLISADSFRFHSGNSVLDVPQTVVGVSDGGKMANFEPPPPPPPPLPLLPSPPPPSPATTQPPTTAGPVKVLPDPQQLVPEIQAEIPQEGKKAAEVEPEQQQKKGGQQEQSQEADEKKTEVKKVEDKKAEVKKAEDKKAEDDNNPIHWLKYPHLNGYFFGLRSLVSDADHIPEYPNPQLKGPVASPAMPSRSVGPDSGAAMPTPTPYNPYPDYHSAAHEAEFGEHVACTLDPEGKVPVPDLYAYGGMPQYHPDPAIGSYDLLGLRDDVCFDRFSRYGPYGLGYSWEKGGTGEGLDTEQRGSDAVWARSGQVDYSRVNWGEAQRRCSRQNQHRFAPSSQDKNSSLERTPAGRLERTAVVIRTYVGFEWTHHSVLNMRAMISELALKTGGEYDVHFLLHVHDETAPIWADEQTAQKILDDEVPDEFHGLCTLWSEAQMRLWYPGGWDDPGPLSNPSGQGIHGVYRSAHMPLQVFAQQHPEYAHFWNWEMDMRYTGSYFELFDRLGRWAESQPRRMLWERSAKYYVPAVHGSWSNFTAQVDEETTKSRRAAVFGQVHFPGWRKLRSEEDGVSPFPEGCTAEQADPWACGVGEAADLITLNPIFDAENSGWVFANDVTGYPRGVHPPRRSAIITASRLSRRLLETMHEENWRHHHSMFSEMFPATAALHHGLKAVYAPHPVYLDRAWEVGAIDRAFNGGRDGSSGGHGSPFDFSNEHNHKGTSWYYNSEFGPLLWRRWLGYGQKDGRGAGGGMAGEGSVRGGRVEEEREGSSGRMCLRQMLVHPIKFENPAERK